MNEKVDKLSKLLPTQADLAELMIEEVLTRWPQTADIFHRHNMACVGCPVAGFYTVADAAGVYDLTQEQFLNELMVSIGQEEG